MLLAMFKGSLKFRSTLGWFTKWLCCNLHRRQPTLHKTKLSSAASSYKLLIKKKKKKKLWLGGARDLNCRLKDGEWVRAADLSF